MGTEVSCKQMLGHMPIVNICSCAHRNSPGSGHGGCSETRREHKPVGHSVLSFLFPTSLNRGLTDGRDCVLGVPVPSLEPATKWGSLSVSKLRQAGRHGDGA